MICVLAACAGGRQPPAGTARPGDPGPDVYRKQMQAVSVLSPDADFHDLRLAYTKTQMYRPYALPSLEPVFAALNGGAHDMCVKRAAEVLERHPLSLGAHFASMVCNHELGHKEQAVYHRYVVNGMMQSITRRGDGRSFATAFEVISTQELYTVLNLMGLQATGQSLVNHEGRPYDVMEVVNRETGERFTLYFDVSLQMSRGMRILS
jgi:hypothetical protein